jgi:hypothetical protein
MAREERVPEMAIVMELAATLPVVDVQHLIIVLRKPLKRRLLLLLLSPREYLNTPISHRVQNRLPYKVRMKCNVKIAGLQIPRSGEEMKMENQSVTHAVSSLEFVTDDRIVS